MKLRKLVFYGAISFSNASLTKWDVSQLIEMQYSKFRSWRKWIPFLLPMNQDASLTTFISSVCRCWQFHRWSFDMGCAARFQHGGHVRFHRLRPKYALWFLLGDEHYRPEWIHLGRWWQPNGNEVSGIEQQWNLPLSRGYILPGVLDCGWNKDSFGILLSLSAFNVLIGWTNKKPKWAIDFERLPRLCDFGKRILLRGIRARWLWVPCLFACLLNKCNFWSASSF